MQSSVCPTIRSSTAEFLIFTRQAGEDDIEARYEDETTWLTQKLMAELFDADVRTVSEHLQNILASDELQEDSVIRKFRITAADGKTYNTNYYNLDAIISVGYRVNSRRAAQFRQWATQALRKFAIQGYAITKRLKSIFDSKELWQDSVCAKFAHTAADRKNYNLREGQRSNATLAGKHFAPFPTPPSWGVGKPQASRRGGVLSAFLVQVFPPLRCITFCLRLRLCTWCEHPSREGGVRCTPLSTMPTSSVFSRSIAGRGRPATAK